MMQMVIPTAAGALAAVIDPGPVFRVGYRPDPWAWTPWGYAGDDGRFQGRFDDPAGGFRTIYAGATLLACLLEVLAVFRADPHLGEDLDGIVEDPDDAERYPSLAPGTVPGAWLAARQATAAMLSGVYCAVTDKETLGTLRPLFVASALRYGLADLDAGVLRLAAPRALTQRIASWLYDLHDGPRDLLDGVRFESRHGDGLALVAIFERDDDSDIPRRLSDIGPVQLDAGHTELREAFRIHRLSWAD